MTRRRGDFIGTRAWQELRRRRLVWAHHQCECCGATDELQLDHIRSRADGNRGRVGLHDVQILCRRCNQAKGTLSLTAGQLAELLGVHRRRPAPRTVFSSKPRIG